MTRSIWLRVVTVAGALALGGVATAKDGGGGGGTDPDRDTGAATAKAKAKAKATTDSAKAQGVSVTPDDSRPGNLSDKRNRDLENSPGGTDETTVPKTDPKAP
jgi:hypothetical protein